MEGCMNRGWGFILPGLPLLSQSAIGPWEWGFHTLRGCVDPGELDFRPRGVLFVERWKDV